MSHSWTPLSTVTRSIRPHEWRMRDRQEELGWIRLVQYQGRPTFVCVTVDDWVVAGGDSLYDAACAFFTWKRSQGR